MRKILALILSITLSAPSMGQVSAADLEKYKSLGTEIAGESSRSRPVYDADGKLSDKKTSVTVEKDPTTGKVVENLFGIQGVQDAGNPMLGNTVGGYTTQKVSAKFSCDAIGATVGVGGVLFYLKGCDGAKTKMAVAVCDSRAGAKCAPNWKESLYELALNSTFAWTGVGTVSNTCNVGATDCQLSLTTKSGTSTTASNLTNAAQAKSLAQGSDSIQADLAKTYASQDYQNKAKKLGKDYNDCVQDDVLGGLQNGGVVKTCKQDDGTTAGTTAFTGSELGTSGSSTCDGAKICKKKAKKASTFTKSCIRQFSATNYVTKRSIPTQECSVTLAKKDQPSCTRVTTVLSTGETTTSGCSSYEEGGGAFFGCSISSNNCSSSSVVVGKDANGVDITKTTTSCDRVYSCYEKGNAVLETNSCTSDQLKDATLVDTSDSQNSCPSWVTGGGGSGCSAFTRYYVFPSKSSLIDGSDQMTPSPISGTVESSCVNHGAGYYAQCDTGGWYRRTVDDNLCVVSVVTGGTAPVTTWGDLTSDDKQGCGYCIKPVMADVCYAAPTAQEPADSCDFVSANQCTLQNKLCTSTDGSLCFSQEETYSCTAEEEVCVEWGDNPKCVNTSFTSMAEGLTVGGSTPASGTGLNNAIGALGVANAISQSLEDSTNMTGGVPRVFGGTDSRCRKPKGSISAILANNCCRTNLERPGGGKPFHQCSFDEVKLAAARRDTRTVYIGEYCSKWIKITKFFKKCVQTTETYCSFPGILPRIVQTQGRVQLAQLASTAINAQIQKQALVFPFYSGNGQWNPPVKLNGSTITTWSAPSYCSDPKTADNPENPQECPISLDVWFASCDKASCGELPKAPWDGSSSWYIVPVNPLKDVTTALSEFAAATGSCDTSLGNCTYDLSAWPAGIGGKAVVSQDLVWPLYAANSETTVKGLSASGADNMNNLGDNVFKPKSLVGTSGPVPATVEMEYSVNAGKTWRTMQLPTNLKGQEIAIPYGGDLKIYGSCDETTLLCSYQVTGTITVTTKPWGSPENPDCSGFTIGQVSALDFGKMDLSEWISTITKQAGVLGNDSGAVAKAAADTFMSTYTSKGTTSSTNPVAARAVIVEPKEEYGPFTSRIYVTGNYPVWDSDASKNKDPISKVVVDWGDCSGKDTLAPTSSGAGGTGYGFTGTHTFQSPDDVPSSCGGGERNIEHPVSVTLYASSGVYTVKTKVVNIWKNYQGTVGNNEGEGGNVSGSTSVQLPGSTVEVPYKKK